VKEHGIVTRDGIERHVDAIILGTGFHADPRDYLTELHITGVGGRNLLDHWSDGAEAYLGISVPGFPNMFELVGPNTGLGHNSLLFMIESQVHYIIECLKLLEEEGAASMDVRPGPVRRFNEELEERLQDTVWTSGCKSWYTQEDGKNIAIWPGLSYRYRMRTRRVNRDHYVFTRREGAATVDDHERDRDRDPHRHRRTLLGRLVRSHRL
jgi:hypothetical protein